MREETEHTALFRHHGCRPDITATSLSLRLAGALEASSIRGGRHVSFSDPLYEVHCELASSCQGILGCLCLSGRMVAASVQSLFLDLACLGSLVFVIRLWSVCPVCWSECTHSCLSGSLDFLPPQPLSHCSYSLQIRSSCCVTVVSVRLTVDP